MKKLALLFAAVFAISYQGAFAQHHYASTPCPFYSPQDTIVMPQQDEWPEHGEIVKWWSHWECPPANDSLSNKVILIDIEALDAQITVNIWHDVFHPRPKFNARLEQLTRDFLEAIKREVRDNRDAIESEYTPQIERYDNN